MSLPTSLSSGLISDSARGISRARPDPELRSAAPISRVPLRSRHEHPATAPARPALRGERARGGLGTPVAGPGDRCVAVSAQTGCGAARDEVPVAAGEQVRQDVVGSNRGELLG